MKDISTSIPDIDEIDKLGTRITNIDGANDWDIKIANVIKNRADNPSIGIIDVDKEKTDNLSIETTNIYGINNLVQAQKE